MGSEMCIRDRLVAMVDGTDRKLHQYKQFFLGVQGKRVEKRQALLLAGVAFSAAALYELHELDSTVDEVKNRQNLSVRQVNSLTDDMEKCEKCKEALRCYSDDEI